MFLDGSRPLLKGKATALRETSPLYLAGSFHNRVSADGMDSSNPVFADSPLKRKCEDSNAIVELFENVRLSPSAKRLRQDFGSTSNLKEFPNQLYLGSNLPCPPVDLELTDVPTTTDLIPDIELPEHVCEPLPANPVNDERALVLYKPVNSPLLLGGPHCSPLFLLKSTMLPSGILDAPNLMHNQIERQLPWLQSARKGDGVTSGAKVTTERTRNVDCIQDDRLAVVPWVSNAAMYMAHSQITTEASKSDILDGMSGEGADVQAMEDDDGLNMEVVHPQFDNASTSFCYEPWQQYGVPQSPYSDVVTLM